MSQNLQSLFQSSQQHGMSRQSIDLLVNNLNGQAGLGCVGAQIDSLNTDDVTLLSVIIDESGSMGSVRDDVIDAFNQMTRALYDSKQRDSILMSVWKFDDAPRLLYSYTPVDQIKDLTRADYNPGGSTALYDAALDGFTGIVGYGQELRNGGIRTRCIVVVITDGADVSSKHTAASVKTIAQDLLKQEIYTLAFVGLGDEATFRQVATSMGFPAVLTTTNTAKDIRRALNMVSGSVIRTSQGSVASNNNGFFNP